ncbi:hypothetical protein JCM6882_003890 [Rhodosporidiobolus microsporus]
MSSFLHRALRHPLYLPPPLRPALADDPRATLTLSALLYAHLLTLSYLSLSPTPYTPLNRLLRLLLLPSTLLFLSKVFLAHRAGDLEPFNESGYGAVGVITAARAVILALGLFGRAGRLRWIRWEWYTHRRKGYWATEEGKEEMKRFDAAVLRGAVPASKEPASPVHSSLKRLALAALFLASPRHLGFSTAKRPSSYRTPPPARQLRYHLFLLLAAGVTCDLVILFYSRHSAYCTFHPDPSLRPSIFDPLPPPYPNLPLPARVALHTLLVGAVIKSSLHLSQSALAVVAYSVLPRSAAAHFPFPSLNLLNPFSLLNPLSPSGPTSVRDFWAKGWHDLLSLDISHLSFLPVLSLTRSRFLALFSAFAFSGLLHTVSLHAVALGPAYGGMLAVFLLQGAAVCGEHVWEGWTGRKVGGRAGKLWTLAVVGASGVILAELYISRGFLGFRRPFSPFGWGLTALGKWPAIRPQPSPSDHPSLEKEYATGFMHQYNVVARRTFLAFYRSPDYGFTRLFNHISIALCVGLTFLNLNSSVAWLQYRVFAIFFISVIPAIIMSQIEPMFLMSRMTFLREASSKMYSPVVFAPSQLGTDMPYSVPPPFSSSLSSPSRTTPCLLVLDRRSQLEDQHTMGFGKNKSVIPLLLPVARSWLRCPQVLMGAD